MYCFDTNIFVDWLRGDEELNEKIQSIQENIFMTSITLCELYKGVYLSSRKDYSLGLIKELIENFDIIGLTKEACEEFGKEFARLEKLGIRTQESDLMIASITKAHNLILITRNKKHFESINVEVEFW